MSFSPEKACSENTSPAAALQDGIPGMADAPRTNLQQIAQQLGVSLSTVSRCLRGDPRFAPATVERIRKAAHELGYRPDPMLSALAGYRERKRKKLPHAALAWLHPYRTEKDLRKRHRLWELFVGARERADSLGYRLVAFGMPDASTVPAVQQILAARGIEGAALCAMHLAPVCETLDFSQLAVVSIGYVLERPRFHAVVPHQFRSALLALEELLRRDSRRVGLALFNNADLRADHLVRAAFGYCREIVPHVAWLPPLILSSGINSADINADVAATGSFCDWCQRHQPDAILTDEWFVIEELLRLGLRVPDDVSVSLTDTAHATALGSGIFENPEVIGARAIEQLAGLVQRREYGVPSIVQHTFVEGSWVEGVTVRPLSDATPEELARREQEQQALRRLPAPPPDLFELVLPDVGYGPGVPAPRGQRSQAKSITTVAKI